MGKGSAVQMTLKPTQWSTVTAPQDHLWRCTGPNYLSNRLRTQDVAYHPAGTLALQSFLRDPVEGFNQPFDALLHIVITVVGIDRGLAEEAFLHDNWIIDLHLLRDARYNSTNRSGVASLGHPRAEDFSVRIDQKHHGWPPVIELGSFATVAPFGHKDVFWRNLAVGETEERFNPILVRHPVAAGQPIDRRLKVVVDAAVEREL